MITKGVRELCSHAESIIETWSVERAMEAYGDDDVVFVDIRDIRELWREGAIPGATLCQRGISIRKAVRILLRWWTAIGSGRLGGA